MIRNPYRRRDMRGMPADVPAPGEVYLEFRPVGAMMRVIAVDAVSGEEVTVFGPISVPREDFSRIACRKLARRPNVLGYG